MAEGNEQQGEKRNQDQALHIDNFNLYMLKEKGAQEISKKLPKAGGNPGKCHQGKKLFRHERVISRSRSEVKSNETLRILNTMW